MSGVFIVIAIVSALQGSVVGTVRNSDTGAPLAGAMVALPDVDRITFTSAEGRYALPDVPPGPQHLTVRMLGYAPRALHALVAPQGTLEINLALQPVPARLRTIDVRAPMVSRGLDAADSTTFPDRAISMAAAGLHPLLSETDALQALAGGEVVVRPESPSGVHVRGGASEHTAYALDGIPVLNPYHAAGVFSAWNPDAISMVRLSSSDALTGDPHALSGTITGVTRAPSERIGAQGGVSTTHARLTIDGPLGAPGGGYVLSLRTAFVGAAAPDDDGSYLRGDVGDWLAKVERPVAGGQLRMLAYANENELVAASSAGSDGAASDESPPNVFEWESRSSGIAWSRALDAKALRLSAWRASGRARAQWGGTEGMAMASERRDHGLLATIEGARRAGGVRVEQIETSYLVGPDASSPRSWSVGARSPLVSAFVRQHVSVRKDIGAELGVTVAALRGVYPAAHLRLRWYGSDNVTITAAYARTHQFAQSLRNAESVVGNIFPADLFASASASEIPVARSDQLIAAAQFRPSPGVMLGAQAWARALRGLVMAAPRTGQPFATSSVASGSGKARGASAEATVSRARYALMASYGWQRVRLRYDEASYVPGFATTHLLDAGAVMFPTPTLSVRLGVTGGAGRRSSIVTGDFEWESCNLADRGCEFGGSPHNEPGPRGVIRLPSYLRLDAGVRKHWHIALGRRDLVLAAYGTVTNVFGRRNLLTYARDPATGSLTDVAQRPLAPLVIGLDWRF